MEAYLKLLLCAEFWRRRKTPVSGDTETEAMSHSSPVVGDHGKMEEKHCKMVPTRQQHCPAVLLRRMGPNQCGSFSASSGAGYRGEERNPSQWQPGQLNLKLMNAWLGKKKIFRTDLTYEKVMKSGETAPCARRHCQLKSREPTSSYFFFHTI